MGVLQWTPDQFYGATYYELTNAYVGHCRANQCGMWAKLPNGWTPEEVKEHKQSVGAIMAAYPDKPLSRKKAGRKG